MKKLSLCFCVLLALGSAALAAPVETPSQNVVPPCPVHRAVARQLCRAFRWAAHCETGQANEIIPHVVCPAPE